MPLFVQNTCYCYRLVTFQLSRHIEALQLLVHTLRDTTSADAYCSLAGCAISPKVAQFLGEKLQLRPWAALVMNLSFGGKGWSSPLDTAPESATAEMRRKLLRILLQVYMDGG